jgi:RNA polymerase sigma-54 factor
MNENPALKLEKMRKRLRKRRIETTRKMMIMTKRQYRSEDINIDEYLSNDEIPDYKHKPPNFGSDDDDDRENHMRQ